MSTIPEILLAAPHSSDALRELYEHFKSKERGFSLQLICKRAGISSRGYLSQVIHGQRTLHDKYKDSISKAFHLDGLSAAVLAALIDLDNASADEKAECEETLRLRRKALRALFTPLPFELAKNPLAFDLFAGIGLFPASPNIQDFSRLYGASREAQIADALALLEKHGFIECQDGCYSVLRSVIVFSGEEGGVAREEFLASSLREAARQLPTWVSRTREAHFEAGLISVRKDAYRAFVPRLQELIVQLQSELEAADADMLVRFGVQLYPVVVNER